MLYSGDEETMTQTLSLPQTLDSTMIVDYRSCREKFRNRYMLHLMGTTKSGDLIAGGAFAAAIEQVRMNVYCFNKTLPEALPSAYRAFVKEWGLYVPPEKSTKTFNNTWIAVEQYFASWPPLSDELQPLKTAEGKPFVEFSFAVPLPINHPESGEPFLYVGRFDLLGTWMEKIVVSDEKTMGQMSSSWAYQWSLRNQFMGYCWGAQQYGYKCNDALIRGVCLTKEIKLAQATANYPDWMLARWYNQLLSDVEGMVQFWKTEQRDYNFGNACTEYGGCPFRDLCVSKTPERWYSSFHRGIWNPMFRRIDPVTDPVHPETGEPAEEQPHAVASGQ